jgi:exopolysaccharide production protein ExoQ
MTGLERLLILLLAGVIMVQLDQAVGLLGRDVTLTGRTVIWDFSLTMIGREPLLGYGFTAFWEGANPPGRLFWMNGLRHFDIHSHNGFIQITLDLGLVGLGLFAVALAVYLARVVRVIASDQDRSARWHLVFAVLLILSNVSESNLLAQNGLLWVLFVALGVRLKQRVRAADSPAAVAWQPVHVMLGTPPEARR